MVLQIADVRSRNIGSADTLVRLILLLSGRGRLRSHQQTRPAPSSNLICLQRYRIQDSRFGQLSRERGSEPRAGRGIAMRQHNASR